MQAERTVRVEIEDSGLVHLLVLIDRPEPGTPAHAQPLR